MKKFINEVSYSALLLMMKARELILKHILNTRGGFLTIGIILGLTSIIILHEGKSQIDYIQTGPIYSKEISVYRASAEEVPEIVGGAVSTATLQEANQLIPNKDSVEELIAHFFPEDAKLAIAVFKAESNLNPKATNKNTNGSIDCGIAQINSVHNPTKEQCENVEENIKLAKSIYDKSGWGAWSSFNNNSFKKHL